MRVCRRWGDRLRQYSCSSVIGSEEIHIQPVLDREIQSTSVGDMGSSLFSASCSDLARRTWDLFCDCLGMGSDLRWRMGDAQGVEAFAAAFECLHVSWLMGHVFAYAYL